MYRLTGRGPAFFGKRSFRSPTDLLTPIQATGNSDGTFSIANVPGGYYWLQIGTNAYWTSSSTFDYGSDIVGQPIGTVATSETTTFAFNIAGLDAVEAGDQFAFLTDWASNFTGLNIGFAIPSPNGSTAMSTNYGIKSNIDYSTADIGVLDAVGAGGGWFGDGSGARP